VADLTLRRYEPADADDVWALHERARRHAGAYDEAYAHLDADLRDVAAEYLATGGEFLLGEREDEVVAMGALQPSDAVDHHETADGTAVVRRLRVDPDHHRQGYGSTVLAALEDRAAELGFDRLVLDTTSQQIAAIGLFEAFGYEERHRIATDAGVEVRVFEKEV
jgi:ribosomal protein S18 acetylase RimI-like enzyme